MTEPSPVSVVDAYLDALAARDFDAARHYLADSGFRYLSPIARYDDADRFIANISRIGPILSRLETRLSFSEGNDVCKILDVTVHLGEVAQQTVVHLARVSEQRITRIEAIFDASEYHRMFAL